MKKKLPPEKIMKILQKEVDLVALAAHIPRKQRTTLFQRLIEVRGNLTKAAETLGMTRGHYYNYLPNKGSRFNYPDDKTMKRILRAIIRLDPYWALSALKALCEDFKQKVEELEVKLKGRLA